MEHLTLMFKSTHFTPIFFYIAFTRKS